MNDGIFSAFLYVSCETQANAESRTKTGVKPLINGSGKEIRMVQGSKLFHMKQSPTPYYPRTIESCFT